MLVPVGKHQGEKPLPLGRLFTLIGSSPSARIYLSSKSVSRCHAVIINTGLGLLIRDLASRTQLRLNGQPVNEADLREGDVIQVGSFSFRFTDPAPAKSRATDPPPPAASLEVDGLDEPLPIQSRTLLIGRRESADVSLTENSASSAHALLFAAEGKHLLRDLNSRTGTFVNGVKVHEHALTPGDMVRIGETAFRYVRTDGAIAAPAERAEAESPRPPIKSEPVAPPPIEPEPDPEKKSDFDFIPLELEPTIPPAGVSAPAAVAESMRDDGPGGSSGIGLVETGAASNGQYVEEPIAENVAPPAPPELPRVAPSAAQPAAPKQTTRWNKASSKRPNVPAAPPRPVRPRNPFDVLGGADELEPLPELPTDADSIPDPASGDNTARG